MQNMEYRDILELVRAIRPQFEKVKALAAFFSLKHSELKFSNELSVWSFMAAQEELHTEAAILDGHIQMLEGQIAKGRITLDHETRVLVEHIQQSWFRRRFQPEDFR